jgi:hypothetical protein
MAGFIGAFKAILNGSLPPDKGLVTKKQFLKRKRNAVSSSCFFSG